MKLKQQRQNGAVLILTLVMLLMLTFYGVVSTRDAKTQYQIAGNTQAFSMALAEAEGVLTKVENSIKCLRAVGVKLTVPTGTLVAVNAACSGSVDTKYLSAGDLSANRIVINDVDIQETPIDRNADGDYDDPGDECFRREIYRITVVSNHPKSGKREVRSDYVVTATDPFPCA